MRKTPDLLLISGSAAGTLLGWTLLVTPFAVASFGARKDNVIALLLALVLLGAGAAMAYAVRAGDPARAHRVTSTILFGVASVGAVLTLLMPLLAFPFY